MAIVSSPTPFGLRAAQFWRHRGGTVLGLLAAAVLALLVWSLLSGTASTQRVVATPPMLMLPPPPPPPPEPEKLPEPEKDIVKPEVTEIEPTPVEPVDKPVDDKAPSPSQDLGDPVSINSDAQAGTDAFGIQAGRGGGSTGTGGGLGAGSYNSYVSNQLQQVLQRDPRTRSLSLDGLSVDLWMTVDGKLTRLQIARGTGNPEADELILATLRGIDRLDERPPSTLRMPMRLSMRFKRQ